MTKPLHPIARAMREVLGPLHSTLTRYMLRAGLMLAVADGESGGAVPAGDPPLMGGDIAPAGDAKPAEGAPAGDAKPAEGEAKPAEGEAKPGDKPADKPAVPEKYEFKAPEGFEKLDDEVVGKFDPVFRELGLSNDQAQKLIDLAPALIGKHATAAAEAATAKLAEDLGYKDAQTWADQIRNDKDIGGDKLAESMAVVLKARDTFAPPELVQMLKTTPLGNHPAMFRMFHAIGKAISEDGFVPGGKARTPTADAKGLYGASQMNP